MSRSCTLSCGKKVVVPAKAVDKIINCTDMPMYVYGTSGLLLELAPRELDLTKVRLRNKSVLYVVGEELENKLLGIDDEFADIIAYPNRIGKGREGDEIYQFSIGGSPVVPITDHCGKSGDTFYH